MKRIVFAAAACLAACQAQAISKCTAPDGATIFQDAPCQGKGETLNIKPASGYATTSNASAAAKRLEIDAINRRFEVRSAIERREPLVGMTTEELQQAMGAPDRANLADYNGKQHNQLIFDRGSRTLYVYTDNNRVVSIQNTASVSSYGKPKERCLSPHEIRAMETSASSITLSEPARVERLRQIHEARKCGR